MNTPSHFLITAAAARLFKVPERWHLPFRALVWGSLAPDIALYLLSVGAAVWYPFTRGWSIGNSLDYAFDHLFFTNMGWIFLHNLLQAPLILLAGIGVALYIIKLGGRRANLGRWLLAFFLAALLHTFLDIITHHDDGPLLLFPFNYQIRFVSPLSYWDPSHYANIVFPTELVLDLICAVYLITYYIKRKVVKYKTSSRGNPPIKQRPS